MLRGEGKFAVTWLAWLAASLVCTVLWQTAMLRDYRSLEG